MHVLYTGDYISMKSANNKVESLFNYRQFNDVWSFCVTYITKNPNQILFLIRGHTDSMTDVFIQTYRVTPSDALYIVVPPVCKNLKWKY